MSKTPDNVLKRWLTDYEYKALRALPLAVDPDCPEAVNAIFNCITRLAAQLDEQRQEQTCGHERRFIVDGGDTHYCALCAVVAERDAVGGRVHNHADVVREFAVEQRQEWVKCSERLPEHENMVLIYQPHASGIDVGRVSRGELSDSRAKDGFSPVYPITHWRELPAPPKDEQDAD